MANLASMFAQLNNTIAANPLAQPVNATVPGMAARPQDTINPMLSSAIKGISGALGADTAPLQTSQEAYLGGMKAIESLDLGTSQGLQQAAQVYQKLGMQPQALALLEKAEAKEQQAIAQKQKQAFSESLIARAEKVGYKDLADSIRTGGGDLQEQAKLVREAEVLDIASTKGWPAQRALLKNAGFTEGEIEQFKGASPEDIKELVEGQKGSVKAYVDADGNPTMLRTSDFGRIWDEQQGKFVDPSSMSLTPAPNVQKVINEGDKLVSKLTDRAFENFSQLSTEAQDAVATLETNTRSESLLNEGINTGFLADFRTGVGKAAALLGLSPELAQDAARSQAYVASRAKQIGQEIKAFGAGTGLSDKDAERAAQIAAGELTMDEDAMRWIIGASNKLAQYKIDRYEDTMESLQSNKQIDQDVVNLLRLPPVQDTTPAPIGGGERTRVYDVATGTFK